MKNGSKNKFLLSCFRPEVVDIDTVLESTDSVNRSSSRRFSCISVTAKHDAEFLEQGTNWVAPQHPPKRKLAKVVKAVVFETILSKRAQYKSNRFSKDCFGSNRSYSEYSESSSTVGDEKSKLRLMKSKETNIREIKARELPLLCSSSSNQISESNQDLSKYESDKEQLQSEKQRMLKCVGLVLALISLAFTVVLGKWRGIFWTSVWLCCFSLLLASFHQMKGFANKLSNSESIANTRIGNHNGRKNH